MSSLSKLSVKSYRGTRDFYPEEMRFRTQIFNTMRSVAESFGYEEYDGPMLESFDLYAAKSGEELVNEQLYHFHDRGNRHVAIRPEMTPTVARMVAAKLNELSRPIRWFSFPNLWRYEKPQRGRLREHWQFNVDILGSDSIGADQEIIEIAIGVMQRLEANPNEFKIHIANRRVLSYFLDSVLGLNENLWRNVCRAIDKKSKIPHEAFIEMLTIQGLSHEQITDLEEYMELTPDQLRHHPIRESQGYSELLQLFEGLDASGVIDFCTLDMSIVRGLDYYTGTVFEMYDQAPENRRALFGGGRYDNLVGLFSKERVSGVGFGMGDVTIRDFLEAHNLLPKLPPAIQVHIALFDKSMEKHANEIAHKVRQAGFKTTIQLDIVKLGKQFKWADAKGIPVVILQGPEEKDRKEVQIKHLPTRKQIAVPENDIIKILNQLISEQ
ncbi:histidine--tRNA ligase [bacterium]|nr:histidine--tRNA ligase [bacterium]